MNCAVANVRIHAEQTFFGGFRCSFVARIFRVFGENFVHDDFRPQVAVFSVRRGREPAVLALAGYNFVYIFFRARNHVFVFQKISEGNKSVQPAGEPFPRVGFAAQPAAVFNVRPHFVEIAGKPRRLNFELPFHPARGVNFARREFLKCFCVFHIFSCLTNITQ